MCCGCKAPLPSESEIYHSKGSRHPNYSSRARRLSTSMTTAQMRTTTTTTTTNCKRPSWKCLLLLVLASAQLWPDAEFRHMGNLLLRSIMLPRYRAGCMTVDRLGRQLENYPQFISQGLKHQRPRPRNSNLGSTLSVLGWSAAIQSILCACP